MPSPTRNLAKAATARGAALAADLGAAPDTPPTPVGALPAPSAPREAPVLGTPPPPAPSAPAGATDRELIEALLREAKRQDPGLNLQPRKGPQATERCNLELDRETDAKMRKMVLDLALRSASDLVGRILVWAKSEATAQGLVWAHHEIKKRRSSAARQRRAAGAGTGDGELPGGTVRTTILLPLTTWSSVKGLWNASGMPKKAFIEAACFLYLAIKAK